MVNRQYIFLNSLNLTHIIDHWVKRWGRFESESYRLLKQVTSPLWNPFSTQVIHITCSVAEVDIAARPTPKPQETMPYKLFLPKKELYLYFIPPPPSPPKHRLRWTTDSGKPAPRFPSLTSVDSERWTIAFLWGIWDWEPRNYEVLTWELEL